ncbi:MAG: PQQ-binding-like beta-propeller repeat protein [Planctomycetaceae bacterium]
MNSVSAQKTPATPAADEKSEPVTENESEKKADDDAAEEDDDEGVEENDKDQPKDQPVDNVQIEVIQNAVPVGKIQIQVQVQGNGRINLQQKVQAEKQQRRNAAARQGKPQPAIQNPLGKLLRRLLPGVPQPAQPQPAGGPGEPAAGDGRDQIDALAPQDPKQASLLKKINKWIEQKQWKPALDGLQQILEKPDDSLFRTPEGRWISTRTEALRIIGTLPPEALKQYRDQYDELAKQLLNDSLRAGDVSGIMEVATKFFHTSSGIEAANWIGTYHLQRGEYVLAGLWFERLFQFQFPLVHEPAWLAKAGLAWQLAGQNQLADTAREKLKSVEAANVTLGGAGHQPLEWLSQPPVLLNGDGQALLAEWTQFLGSPSRTASMVGEDPLLLRRWTQRTTDDRKILDQIQLMHDDLVDEGMSILPAWSPLAVNGKVVFRTLDGIRVVDGTTGKMIWETDVRFSPGRLLVGNAGQPNNFMNVAKIRGNMRGRVNVQMGGQFNFMIAQNHYSGNGATHPLMNLLLQDAAYGTISSDGDRIFLLEDQAVLSHRHPGAMWGGDPNDEDPYRRDWTSNRLTAYNLKSGRSLWEVGGEQREEPFDLPLAGECFLGPPLVDGGELVIAGERDNELRIFGLDPQTGQERWSQLISYINTKIEQDLVRRWWPLHISSSQGVLVCPTGVGWLLGIDRRQQSLLWAYRYAPPQANPNENRQQFVVTEYRPLNARWTTSAPMIVGHRVLYTPAEEPTLVCLNLQDGKLLWQQPKGSFLYLAGVAHDRAIMVGTDAVSALSLETGEEAWKIALTEADGRPCGSGVFSGDNYYVPLQSGQLWKIDTKKGEKLSVTYLPDGTPLGNLLLYRNQLLSQSPFGMESFELRQPILADLERRRLENPDDQWAHLREAEIAALGHHSADTLTHLHRITRDKLDPADRERFDLLLGQTLQELIRGNLKGQDAEFEELKTLAVTPDDRQTVIHLSLARMVARGELTAALDTLWNLMRSPAIVSELSILIPATEGRRSARIENLNYDDWLAGRFVELYQLRNIDLNAALTNRLHEYATEVAAGDLAMQERFVKLFGFHPASLPIRQQLAERALAAGRWLEAEQELLHLTRHSGREQQAQSWLKLAEMYQQNGFPQEAFVCYRRLEQKYADVILPTGQTSRALFDELTKMGKLPLLPPISELSWDKTELQMTRSGTGYMVQAYQELMLRGGTWPFFQQFRFQILPQEERLNINGADTGVYWSVPLRSKSGFNYSGVTTAIADDHQLMINHRDVIHRLSLLERKVLWSWPLDERPVLPAYYHQQQMGVQPLIPALQWVNKNDLNRQNGPGDPLTVANENYVCIAHRRGVTVLDSRTGRVRWKRTDLPAQSRVFGNADYLVVNTPQSSQAMILRALDGQAVELPEFSKLIPHTLMVTEHGFLVGQRDQTEAAQGNKGAVALELLDPSSQSSLWKVAIPAGSHIGQSQASALSILHATGALHTLNLETGELTLLGKIPVDEDNKRNPEVFVFSDAFQTYAVSNNRQGNIFQPENMPSVRINGHFSVFRPDVPEAAWTMELNNINLCLESLKESPVLVFAAREYKQAGNFGYWETHLQIVDKSAGSKLIECSTPSNSGFNVLRVDGPKRTIELRSYNELIRIHPVETQAAK